MIKIVLLSISAAILLYIATFFIWALTNVAELKSDIVTYLPYQSDGNRRYERQIGPRSSLEWSSLHQVSEVCVEAIVIAEDSNFYYHYGVDFEQLQDAFETNQDADKIIRGGSTITQQLVKNLFLSRDKTYWRKWHESLASFVVDTFVSKDEQLEWYLNIVEFGPGIYGIKNASRSFFNKEPLNLNLRECVALTSILPGPKYYYADMKNNEFSNKLAKRAKKITRIYSRQNPQQRRNSEYWRQKIYH